MRFRQEIEGSSKWLKAKRNRRRSASYINTLADVDLDVLRAIIKGGVRQTKKGWPVSTTSDSTFCDCYLLQPGYASNYTDRRSPWIYFSETLQAATWGAERATGDGPCRIHPIEPTGLFTDDPNLTDKKFPGNPTKSYRSHDPLRIVSEYFDWQGHSAEEIQAMKDGINGKEPIDD